MIKLNLENAVTPSVLEKYADNVKKIAQKMQNLESVGFEFLGWKDLPQNFNKFEFERIKEVARKLHHKQIEVLVVIGIGGSYTGARAAIEMVQGFYPEKRAMEIVYAGESLSSTDLVQKLKYVDKKSFAINVISKSGTTTEPAIAFRLFRDLLESRVGAVAARELIIATTDANRGALLKIAKDNQYETFNIPDNIGGRFSVLTPVGLFPMACAGLDIDAIMHGAKRGWKHYSIDDLRVNIAYQYAVARFLLGHKFPIELFVPYEPQLRALGEWWKQLTGESEGKNQQGVFPASAIFSTDLHSLGQFVQEGSKVLFETMITINTPKYDLVVPANKKNLDNLNYLADKTVHTINNVVFQATSEAHTRIAKVPCIHLSLETLSEETFGEVVMFFMYAIAMSAYLANVNPFNQPGVEIYKQNMFKVLGKPE